MHAIYCTRHLVQHVAIVIRVTSHHNIQPLAHHSIYTSVEQIRLWSARSSAAFAEKKFGVLLRNVGCQSVYMYAILSVLPYTAIGKDNTPALA